MSNINYEITLYHSPYHDTLVEELGSLIKQKKSIYKNIYSESEFNDKLSYEEREILKHLIAKEDRILLELIKHKRWHRRFSDHELSRLKINSTEKEFDDESEYGSHRFGY